MRSNFHDVLKLVDGVVQAGGPIQWDEGESQGIITVIINQGGVRVGVASSPPILHVSEGEWKLAVPSSLPDLKLRKGAARAFSEICAIGEGGMGIPFQWSQTVHLKE